MSCDARSALYVPVLDIAAYGSTAMIPSTLPTRIDVNKQNQVCRYREYGAAQYGRCKTGVSGNNSSMPDRLRISPMLTHPHFSLLTPLL